MDNPFDGLMPDFSVFGAEFTEWWQKLFAGFWALAFIAAAGFLLAGILALRRATNQNMPGQVDEAKSTLAWRAAALAGVIGFGVIITAVITLVG